MTLIRKHALRAFLLGVVTMGFAVTTQAGGTGYLSVERNGNVLVLKTVPSQGVLVKKATPDGAWGLHAGDMILAINGTPATDPQQLLAACSAHPGKTPTLRIHRANTTTQHKLGVPGCAAFAPPKRPTARSNRSQGGGIPGVGNG